MSDSSCSISDGTIRNTLATFSCDQYWWKEEITYDDTTGSESFVRVFKFGRGPVYHGCYTEVSEVVGFEDQASWQKRKAEALSVITGD